MKILLSSLDSSHPTNTNLSSSLVPAVPLPSPSLIQATSRHRDPSSHLRMNTEASCLQACHPASPFPLSLWLKLASRHHQPSFPSFTPSRQPTKNMSLNYKPILSMYGLALVSKLFMYCLFLCQRLKDYIFIYRKQDFIFFFGWVCVNPLLLVNQWWKIMFCDIKEFNFWVGSFFFQ